MQLTIVNSKSASWSPTISHFQARAWSSSNASDKSIRRPLLSIRLLHGKHISTRAIMTSHDFDFDFDLDLTSTSADDLFASPTTTTTPSHPPDASKPGASTHSRYRASSATAAADRAAALEAELASVRAVNGAVEAVLASLGRAKHNMDTVATTVTSASSLLNTWSRILSQTEHNQRLVLDPAWQGAGQDVLDKENDELLRRQEAERREAAADEEERRRQREREESRRREEQGQGAGRGRLGSRGAAARGAGRGRAAAARAGGAVSSGYGAGGTAGRGVGRGVGTSASRGASGTGRGGVSSTRGRARGVR